MFSLSATSLFEFPASKSRSTSISLSVSSMFGFSAICTAGADVEMIFGVLPSNFSTSGISTVSSISVWILSRVLGRKDSLAVCDAGYFCLQMEDI